MPSGTDWTTPYPLLSQFDMTAAMVASGRKRIVAPRKNAESTCDIAPILYDFSVLPESAGDWATPTP
jgi:hypothetical protein